MSHIVRKAILEAGVLEIGHFEFAGDKEGIKRSNNKLNFDHLLRNPKQLRIVTQYLGRAVSKYQPEALVGVPSGGEFLAEAVNLYSETSRPIVYLDKDQSVRVPGKKKFKFRDLDDQDLLDSVQSVVIIEDVFNQFTSTRGVLEVEDVHEKTRAAVGVWDRGVHPSRAPLSVLQEALVTEYIPREIDSNDKCYFPGSQVAV